MLIAPATANTLSKMANGTSDNLLLSNLSCLPNVLYILLQQWILDMYRASIYKRQVLVSLESFGNICIPVASGELASGLSWRRKNGGTRRYHLDLLNPKLLSKLPLRGKKVLITAGPTYEAIDPVRFIGNHSSGKMGFELAKAAANLRSRSYFGYWSFYMKKLSIHLIK